MGHAGVTATAKRNVAVRGCGRMRKARAGLPQTTYAEAHRCVSFTIHPRMTRHARFLATSVPSVSVCVCRGRTTAAGCVRVCGLAVLAVYRHTHARTSYMLVCIVVCTALITDALRSETTFRQGRRLGLARVAGDPEAGRRSAQERPYTVATIPRSWLLVVSVFVSLKRLHAWFQFDGDQVCTVRSGRTALRL